MEQAWHAGAAVAWVRNTVNDCLHAAALLRERKVDVVVFHARFAQCDRQTREREVMARFGKDGAAGGRRGPVLVATQVIEQSLDLDFDAMVTDLAPMDLIIQRAGRLWRHNERVRPLGPEPELVVFTPSPDEEPSLHWLGGPFKGTAFIYENPSVLWRTARVLRQVGEIRTPSGLRHLVEEVYDGAEVPKAFEAKTAKAEGKARGESATATYGKLNVTDGYSAGGKAWQSDLRVPTRLGEEQATVRLARAVSGETLAPWCQEPGEAWKVWALSEVRLWATKVPTGSLPEPRWARAAAAVRKQWGAFEQELTLLPLERGEDGRWRGCLTPPGDRKPVTVRYTVEEGLVFEADGT